MKTRTIFALGTALALILGAFLEPAASQASSLAGTVSGTVLYSGVHDANHEVLVAAHLDPNNEPQAVVHIVGPGAYTLADLPEGTYYISAFLDLNDNGDGPADTAEPLGWYDPNGDDNPDPITINGGNISGIDITLTDIPIAIQGTACYLGGVTGPGAMEIALHPNPNDGPVVSQYVARPCAEYFLGDGPHGTYYMSLFYDVNGSGGPPEAGEPVGWYDANGDGTPDPIAYAGSTITDVDITIGNIHYVDFSAAGEADGTSWADAFPDLQEALSIAQPGEEIWVAAGIYFPGTTREASFVLPHGVAVYGGFRGSEVFRNQRNLRANLTVLSGEIGNPNIKTDNTYHVVTTASTYQDPVDATTILDGFTITGGHANVEAGDTEKGGGFLNSFGTPTLVNLNFVGNYALNHGGALATKSNVAPLIVVNCTFSGNQATHNAGGIGNLSRLVVINSAFTGNSGSNGGGIVNLSGSHAEIYNSILWGNPGGQIALQGDAVVTATYSLVEGGFAWGEHILTNDPLFVDADGPDDVLGTLDDDLRLQAGSPALDAGDNTQLPGDAADSNGNGNNAENLPLDFEGDSRTLDDPAPDSGNGTAPFVDLGADERADPVAISSLSIAAVPNPSLLDEPILFSARVIEGTQVSYAWDFGDGNVGSGPLPAHSFAAPGEYTVTLTASNNLGFQQASAVITVTEALAVDPGGSETTSDGVLTFSIPTTVTGTVTFAYTPQAALASTPGGFEFAGLAFDLRAADAAGNPIIEPDEPFTLTIHYDESALPAGTDETTLELYRYDADSEIWLALIVLARDPENDTLTVRLDHFSKFVLLVEAADTSYQINLPLVIR